ncbi:hypothetical protein [Streptococcus sp.]|nr:hypothetical protein [Streptococcus sp.]MDY3823874.1 hypothetical protein [Streptococcus sp.]
MKRFSLDGIIELKKRYGVILMLVLSFNSARIWSVGIWLLLFVVLRYLGRQDVSDKNQKGSFGTLL